MSQIDVKLLKSFVVFADSANIVEASQVLGISQPALSAHLRLLEELPTPEDFYSDRTQENPHPLWCRFGISPEKTLRRNRRTY